MHDSRSGTTSKQPYDQALILANSIHMCVFVSRQGTVHSHKLLNLLCVSKLKFHVKPQLFLFQRKHLGHICPAVRLTQTARKKLDAQLNYYFQEQIANLQARLHFEGYLDFL